MSHTSSLTLAQVVAELNAWRTQGRQGAIPHPIREQAVALLADHKVSHVIDALGINHRMMRQWRQQYPPQRDPQSDVSAPTRTPAFVTLAPVAERCDDDSLLPTLKLTHQHKDLSLTLEGRLSLAQWQQTLSLLQQLALN